MAETKVVQEIDQHAAWFRHSGYFLERDMLTFLYPLGQRLKTSGGGTNDPSRATTVELAPVSL